MKMKNFKWQQYKKIEKSKDPERTIKETERNMKPKGNGNLKGRYCIYIWDVAGKRHSTEFVLRLLLLCSVKETAWILWAINFAISENEWHPCIKFHLPSFLLLVQQTPGSYPATSPTLACLFLGRKDTLQYSREEKRIFGDVELL